MALLCGATNAFLRVSFTKDQSCGKRCYVMTSSLKNATTPMLRPIHSNYLTQQTLYVCTIWTSITDMKGDVWIFLKSNIQRHDTSWCKYNWNRHSKYPGGHNLIVPTYREIWRFDWLVQYKRCNKTYCILHCNVGDTPGKVTQHNTYIYTKYRISLRGET